MTNKQVGCILINSHKNPQEIQNMKKIIFVTLMALTLIMSTKAAEATNGIWYGGDNLHVINTDTNGATTVNIVDMRPVWMKQSGLPSLTDATPQPSFTSNVIDLLTMNYVVTFAYGTNTSFIVRTAPDMTYPLSERGLIAGELVGVAYSPPDSPIPWIRYTFKPSTFGTSARVFWIRTNYPANPS